VAFDSAAILAPLSAALYCLAASLDLLLQGPDGTVLSPQHGVLVALCLATRREHWWLIAVAVLPAHLIAYWSTDLPVGQLAWQACFSCILATGIVTALRLLLGQRNPFDSLRDLSIYIATAVVVGPALLTLLAPEVVSALLTGTLHRAVVDWQAQSIASALAMLTWTPWIYLSLLPRPGWLQQRTPIQYVEALAIAAALYAALHWTFIAHVEHHALYLLFIPLLWQSVRFGVDAAAIAVTLIATLASAADAIPHSARIREAPYATVLDLQIFLSVMALIALVIAIIVDERRRVAQAASASDARYRAIVDSQTDFVCRSLPDSTLTFVNAALCRYFGLPREQVLGTRWLQFVPSETRDELQQALCRVTPEHPTFVLKHPVRFPDGRSGWQEWINTAIFDSNRQLVEFQGTGRDITALVQAEQALRRNNERLSLIARASCDVIYEWDIVRGQLWSSAGDDSSEGAPSVRHLNMDTWGFSIHPSDRDRVVRDCREALRGTAATWQAEYLYIGPDGSPPRWVRHRAYIIRDSSGLAVRMIGAITDRSDRKNLEEANRTLERFARLAMLGQITASIAHEMNQPLSAIRYNAEAGLLFLNRGRNGKEEFQEIFDDICRDSRRATDLVNRLRELLHEHELRLDPVDVNEVVNDVVNLLRIELRQRHVRIETECTELPTVLADSGRLQQVLLNLILNGMDAMATLPEAHRRIAIRTARVGTRIQVEVVDRGAGIDSATLPKIFDSFFTSKDQGMGLGLAIARSIVEAHGGKIWAKNNADGKGATLAFEIDSLGSKVMLASSAGSDRYGARLN
jgi:PAS domain S-box-containing protein